MSDVLKLSQHGNVLVMTIDDPATRNALSPALFKSIVSACDEANRDIDIKCVVLTGAGDVFCAGGNIKDMYNRVNHFAGNAAEIRRSYRSGVQTVAEALYGLEIPSIAAVNGAAMGAGLDFAAMCNIRIAADNAIFAESFIRLGLTSAAGGAWFLTRAIGDSAAAELTLTGEKIDAGRAKELGLISRIVPREKLLDEALDIGNKIARHPAHSIRLNTRLLRESRRLDLPAALELASAMQAVVQQTDDQYEAVAAAVEKRKPSYKGR